MAKNKIVPGPKDDQYGEPKGTKFEKLYLKKKGWVKNKKNRSKLTASAVNNIRRLKDSGHETDYTGGFRLSDDGKLIPVMGIRKKQAKANNIRRFSESGHQLVIDDNDPRKLKIIKRFRPRA